MGVDNGMSLIPGSGYGTWTSRTANSWGSPLLDLANLEAWRQMGGRGGYLSDADRLRQQAANGALGTGAMMGGRQTEMYDLLSNTLRTLLPQYTGIMSKAQSFLSGGGGQGLNTEALLAPLKRRQEEDRQATMRGFVGAGREAQGNTTLWERVLPQLRSRQDEDYSAEAIKAGLAGQAAQSQQLQSLMQLLSGSQSGILPLLQLLMQMTGGQ